MSHEWVAVFLTASLDTSSPSSIKKREPETDARRLLSLGRRRVEIQLLERAFEVLPKAWRTLLIPGIKRQQDGAGNGRQSGPHDARGGSHLPHAFHKGGHQRTVLLEKASGRDHLERK